MAPPKLSPTELIALAKQDAVPAAGLFDIKKRFGEQATSVFWSTPKARRAARQLVQDSRANRSGPQYYMLEDVPGLHINLDELFRTEDMTPLETKLEVARIYSQAFAAAARGPVVTVFDEANVFTFGRATELGALVLRNKNITKLQPVKVYDDGSYKLHPAEDIMKQFYIYKKQWMQQTLDLLNNPPSAEEYTRACEAFVLQLLFACITINSKNNEPTAKAPQGPFTKQEHEMLWLPDVGKALTQEAVRNIIWYKDPLKVLLARETGIELSRTQLEVLTNAFTHIAQGDMPNHDGSFFEEMIARADISGPAPVEIKETMQTLGAAYSPTETLARYGTEEIASSIKPHAGSPPIGHSAKLEAPRRMTSSRTKKRNHEPPAPSPEAVATIIKEGLTRHLTNRIHQHMTAIRTALDISLENPEGAWRISKLSVATGRNPRLAESPAWQELTERIAPTKASTFNSWEELIDAVGSVFPDSKISSAQVPKDRRRR